MTFSAAHNLFLNDDKISESNSLFQNYIEVKIRKFCVDCLLEKISYNLIWQIKNISICNRHNKLLSANCNSCGRFQPYLSDSLYKGSCYFCNEPLTSLTNRSHVVESDSKIQHNRKCYTNWEFLLNSDLSSLIEIHPDKSKALAIRLFFLLHQKEDPVFSIGAIEYLSKDFRYRLLKFI